MTIALDSGALIALERNIASFDAIAKAVGELCGRARTKDICDAQVAIVASRASVLYTSDPGDMKRLIAA